MDKKSQFAEYITAKRKAANLTQQEFADMLYVTNTAVSKWERGVSYPDITLISSICEILNVTAQELIGASDDTAARRAKAESGYYRNTAKWYHLITLGAYAVALIACFITNLAVEGTLSWFFLVLPSILLSASLTNLPFAVRHAQARHHMMLKIANFAAPLLFLEGVLLAACLFTGGTWLLTATLGVLLGYSICVLPFALGVLPMLKKADKILISLTVPLLLLGLLLLQVCLWTGGDWFLTAFLGVLTGYMTVILPIILYYWNDFTRKWNWLISLCAAFLTAGLLILVSYIQYFA